MPSIFSRIVAGEIPCYKVAETDDFLAFLDVNPVVKGHVLCIPKKEVDYIFDLDDAVVGIDVPHTHIHLMPLNNPGDLNFSHHVKMEPDEMKVLASQIAAAIE